MTPNLVVRIGSEILIATRTSNEETQLAQAKADVITRTTLQPCINKVSLMLVS